MEELLDEHEFLSRSPEGQREMILRHCGPLQEQLQSVRTRTEALTLVDLWCDRFSSRCSSSILRSAVRRTALEMVDAQLPA